MGCRVMEIRIVLGAYLVLLSVVLPGKCLGNIQIHTKLGYLQGIVEVVRNENVYQFRNIPFAEPPIGRLRFAKSLSHRPWTGVLNATAFGPSCMQPPSLLDRYSPNTYRSEDCLSLNVYVPRSLSPDGSRSVMVFIFGGGNLEGQGMVYDGSYLALTGDVIVVTVNYRLGVFGFLTTPEDNLPGNYGLWDQRLSLEWVQQNIASFGGNPDSVTLFGQSAGGFSVALHAINPKNKGLFHRVIAHSGVAEGHYALWQGAYSYAKQIGVLLGCSNGSTIPTTYASCMRAVSSQDLLHAQNTMLLSGSSGSNLRLDLIVGPVVDGDLLPLAPRTLLGNKTSPSYQFFRSLDYITGNVDTEGSTFLPLLASVVKENNFNISNGVPRTVFCADLTPALLTAYFDRDVNSTAASHLLCSRYGTPDPSVQAHTSLDVYADALYIAPTVKTLDIHSHNNSQSTTYQYLFRRPIPDPLLREYPPWWRNGSAHGAELYYLFGIKDYEKNRSIPIPPSDVGLSSAMIKYWANFAKTGNPNSDDIPRWEAYDVIRQDYVNLDTSITWAQHLYQARVHVWLQTLPGIVQDPTWYPIVGR